MNTASFPVLRPEDLEPDRFGDRCLAVLGHPIGHSLSPAMHNAALAWASGGRPELASVRYHRFDVEPGALARTLGRMHRLGFRGLNLTVPHKVAGFAAAAQVDPEARAAGSVNTLQRTDSGWKSYCTDGYGFSEGLRGDLGLSLTGASVLLLGAGGAARAVAAQCLREGCASLWIGNRSAPNLERLLRALDPIRGEARVEGFLLGQAPGLLPSGAIVVNATSSGLAASDQEPLDWNLIPRPGAAYDLIYNPARTKFLQGAAERSIPFANGLSMLVHQGAKALEIWTGIPAIESAPVMRKAALEALRGKG